MDKIQNTQKAKNDFVEKKRTSNGPILCQAMAAIGQKRPFNLTIF